MLAAVENTDGEDWADLGVVVRTRMGRMGRSGRGGENGDGEEMSRLQGGPNGDIMVRARRKRARLGCVMVWKGAM